MAKNEFICDCNMIHKEVVDTIKKEIPNEKTFHYLATFFKLIADETRLRILFVLAKKETCVCDIANILSMSKSSISHQLATLRNSGIVKCRKEGKEAYYSLDDAHVTKVFEVAIDHIKHKGEENI